MFRFCVKGFAFLHIALCVDVCQKFGVMRLKSEFLSSHREQARFGAINLRLIQSCSYAAICEESYEN